MTRLSLLSAALLAGLALPAAAQAPGPRGDRPDFATLDADGDGLLTQEELQSYRDAQAAQRFAEIDADGDGALTLQEMQAAPAARFAARMLERFDADGDGALTAQELHTGARERGIGRRGDVVARLDADGDGAISAQEFAARRAVRGPRHGHGARDR